MLSEFNQDAKRTPPEANCQPAKATLPLMCPPQRRCRGHNSDVVTFPAEPYYTNHITGRDQKEYLIQRWNELRPISSSNSAPGKQDYFIRVLISPLDHPGIVVGEITAHRVECDGRIYIQSPRVLVSDPVRDGHQGYRNLGLSYALYQNCIDSDVTDVRSKWEVVNREVFLHTLCRDNFNHVWPVRDISAFAEQWSNLAGFRWKQQISTKMFSEEFGQATIAAGQHTPSCKALSRLGFELTGVYINPFYEVSAFYGRKTT